MTTSVRLDPGLRPSAALAHRNALLTLPGDFRLVDGPADLVVVERATADRDAATVVVGAPQHDDPAGWYADGLADRDPAARAFASEVAARATSDQVYALTVRLEAARADGIDAAEVAEQGERLAALALPALAGARGITTRTAGVVSHVYEVGPVRVSVTALIVSMPAYRLSARALGDGVLASLVVPAAGAARPSTYSLATEVGTSVFASPYSSAERELWSSIASTV